jgi:nucleoside-diphosphate-sugar epimerase
MSKIFLITGSTGFIGKHVLESLNNNNIQCRLLIRTGSKEKIFFLKNVEKIIESDDIFNENLNWWLNACDGIHTIIHIAWYAEHGKYLNSLNNLDCLNGSLLLSKAACIKKVKKFVGIGTCLEYDLNIGILDIQTPLNPQSLYASSKLSLYYNQSQLFKLYDIDFNWCRIFYIYGEGENNERLIPFLNNNLKNNKRVVLVNSNKIRDYLDVKIAANLIYNIAIEKNTSICYNICSGISKTIKEIAEEIADQYNNRHLLTFEYNNKINEPLSILGINNYKQKI